MSIFDEEDTLCSRNNNKCRHRKKCWRYVNNDRLNQWDANYWEEFGGFCDYFIIIPVVPKTKD